MAFYNCLNLFDSEMAFKGKDIFKSEGVKHLHTYFLESGTKKRIKDIDYRTEISFNCLSYFYLLFCLKC